MIVLRLQSLLDFLDTLRKRIVLTAIRAKYVPQNRNNRSDFVAEPEASKLKNRNYHANKVPQETKYGGGLLVARSLRASRHHSGRLCFGVFVLLVAYTNMEQSPRNIERDKARSSDMV